MNPLTIVVIVVVVAVISLVGYSLCKIAGDSDEVMEQAFLEMLEEENGEDR